MPSRADRPSPRRTSRPAPPDRNRAPVRARKRGTNRPPVRVRRPVRRRARRRTPFLWKAVIAAVLGALVFFTVAGVVSHTAFRQPEIRTEQPSLPTAADNAVSGPHETRKKDFYVLLLAGVDDGNGGSDTILLAGFDTKGKAVRVVSIPRDLKAVVNGRARKINAAYNAGGMECLARTISDLLGIPVDYTIEVNLEGFVKLVDAVGGVDFEVPLDMDYDDPEQNLAIHVRQGLQHLDGETALKVVRFRHNNDGTGYGTQDLGRIGTQQKFLKEAARKLLSPATLFRLEELAGIFRTYVDTELTLSNLAWFGKEAVRIGAERVEFATLPGEWKTPYLYADPSGTLDMVNDMLNPCEEARTMDDLHLPA